MLRSCPYKLAGHAEHGSRAPLASAATSFGDSLDGVACDSPRGQDLAAS